MGSLLLSVKSKWVRLVLSASSVSTDAVNGQNAHPGNRCKANAKLSAESPVCYPCCYLTVRTLGEETPFAFYPKPSFYIHEGEISQETDVTNERG